MVSLLIVVFSSAKGSAQALKSWVCDTGSDSNITLQLTEGTAQFKFQVCAFHVCSPYNLTETAQLISSSPNAGQYTYETHNKYGRKEMVLRFSGKNQLEEVTIGGSGYFYNCADYNIKAKVQ